MRAIRRAMLTYDVVEGFTKEMSELYSSAFTEIEKVPEENILRTIGRGGKLIEYRDDGRFIGFTLTFTSGEWTFWIYLATIPEVRGKGYGSKLIDMVRETHPGKRIFLVVEPMDVTSDDYEMRVRRQRFYERNGCVNSDITLISDDAPFDSMYVSGVLTEDEMRRTVSLYEDIHNGKV